MQTGSQPFGEWGIALKRTKHSSLAFRDEFLTGRLGIRSRIILDLTFLVGFIIIFVIGHAMNLAINALGAYVHTNRLQYVEFFGKFYEGGGRELDPLTENTKYYRVKEAK